MNQQEVEAWIASQGGNSAVQYSRSTKTVDNPAADPLTAKAAGVKFDLTAPEKISVSTEQWVNSKTGAKLHVSRKDDGNFDIIENSTADPNKPSAATSATVSTNTTEPYIVTRQADGSLKQEPNPNYKPPAGDAAKPPETKDEGGRRYQWQPNPGGASAGGTWKDVGAAPLTAAEQAQQPASAETPVTGRSGWVQITTKNGNSTSVKFRGPDGTVVDALPAEAPKDTPTTVTRNGKTYVQHTVPGADGKPGRIYWTDPSGAETTLPDENGKDGFAAEPEGAPPPNDSPGQISAGLRTYSSWLSSQVKLHRDTGGKQGVSPEEATKLMDRRISVAESVVKEQSGLATTQGSQRGQDITQRGQSLSDTQSRRTAASTAWDSVQKSTTPLLEHLRPGDGGTFVGAQQEMLQNAIRYAQQFGGLRESPEVGTESFPALQQMRQASMQGIQTAAAGGPEIFQARPVTAPIPSGADVAGANAAAQAGTANAIGPLLGPRPNVSAPALASPPVPVAANPINTQPIAMPADAQAAANAGPVPGQDASVWTPPGATPPPAPVAPYQDSQTQMPPPPPAPAAPDYGAPGMNMLPQPGAAPQIDPSVPYPNDAATQSQMQPMSPLFMQQARYGQSWDSGAAAAELAERLGIDPEIMKQAHAGLYG